MNLPSGLERRHLVLAGAAVVVLVVSLVMFTSGGDEQDAVATVGGGGQDATRAPVVPSDPAAEAAAPSAPQPVARTDGGASKRAGTARGPDPIARSLESQLARSLPPVPSTSPDAAPRPSAGVQAAADLLRAWHVQWQACLRTTDDFRDCDTSTPTGVRLANVADMGSSYSLTASTGHGTVVTLALVRGTQCRSTSRTPRDCDAWR